ncbi:Protein DEHYDRATION-INDUCED 19 homolog 3 [Striga hermonthica]|uniref:Protein DEHYDRATION-INDUCED 19 homolog 3 n=1 Tax=Striga hermonthica TaxID=68872 RepID=A0A9N7N8Z4_STRHE|nr:Protein DEHYDRATION-INDUCED 19 homolog 3 [Striga hermonthica]
MDSDFWATRIAAAKRQFNLQSHHNLGRSHHSSQLDFEGDEEARPEYPCSYCYEEFDLTSLCSHLESHHSFESKPTVCSICSAKVTGDMLSHITRRSRLRRVPFANNQSLSLLGRDLREAHLQVLLGGNGYRSTIATSSSSSAVADNLLSSLILSFSASELDDVSKSLLSSLEESSAKSTSSQHFWKSSFYSLSREEREKRMQQAAGRAVFVQDLLVSTLLAD